LGFCKSVQVIFFLIKWPFGSKQGGHENRDDDRPNGAKVRSSSMATVSNSLSQFVPRIFDLDMNNCGSNLAGAKTQVSGSKIILPRAG
jgi:hypothetical protein